MRGRVHRALGLEPAPLLGRDLHAHLVCDRPRDLALQREDVGELALVAVRPQGPVARGIDQLRGDAHAPAGEQGRALDHRVHAQLARDLRQRPIAALEAHGRCARDHAQRSDLRQVGDERIGHAVHEELLARIPGAVGERQHDERADAAAQGRAPLSRFLAPERAA